jgi:hypothetical protein
MADHTLGGYSVRSMNFQGQTPLWAYEKKGQIFNPESLAVFALGEPNVALLSHDKPAHRKMVG